MEIPSLYNDKESRIEELTEKVSMLDKSYKELQNKYEEVKKITSAPRFSELTKEERKNFKTALDDDMLDVFWSGNIYVDELFSSIDSYHWEADALYPTISTQGLYFPFGPAVGYNMYAYRNFVFELSEKYKDIRYRTRVSCDLGFNNLELELYALDKCGFIIENNVLFGFISNNDGLQRARISSLEDVTDFKTEFRLSKSGATFYFNDVQSAKLEAVPNLSSRLFYASVTNTEAVEKTIFFHGYEFMQKI
jgi:hypothetical protein